MKDVYINGKRVVLNPLHALGKGGEADVYDLGNGCALKIFKDPGHPDFLVDPEAREQAKQRIKEHQTKLADFPRSLPIRVVRPLELARLKDGSIAGYVMEKLDACHELIRYSDSSFRHTLPADTIRRVFQDLHATISSLHTARVVIGDFNDLNVLVKGEEAHIIDADSFQFGHYLCHMFTARFADPVLCDPKARHLALARPHTADSDWYAYAVMLMQSLLSVDPYGGIYKPDDPQKRIPHDARPLRRITVFHPDVRYPKPAVPYDRLPDDLLQYFHRVFEKDMRGPFPLALIEPLRWTACAACGTEHARAVCPTCALAAPAAITHKTVVRGRVTCTRIMQTRGRILAIGKIQEKIAWLVHENRALIREDGKIALNGNLEQGFRYKLMDNATLIGNNDQVAILRESQSPEILAVDQTGHEPCFAANPQHMYWANNGQLWRDGSAGPEHIGDVLQNQTRIWMGEKFGFGLYRAGRMNVAFTFDAENRGLNDQVDLPPMPGKLVDVVCEFSDDMCWILVAAQDHGHLRHTATVIGRDGKILATASATAGDGSWLGTLHGKCAISDFLFAPTDDGIVRVQAQNGSIAVTREYPDTEPFVDSSCTLLPDKKGLVVADAHEIRLLSIA